MEQNADQARKRKRQIGISPDRLGGQSHGQYKKDFGPKTFTSFQFAE